MKVHIYFRHTDISRATKNDRPDWFSHELCFKNLISTIENSHYKDKVIFNFIFDGTESSLESDSLYKHFNDMKLENKKIYLIKGGDQRKAWKECINIVTQNRIFIDDHDLIYLLENDYVHTDWWLEELYNLKNSKIDWDIATLYDHPDKYQDFCKHIDASKNKNIKTKVFFSGHHHWKLAPSTCATYVIKAEVFNKIVSILKLAIYDYKLFFILTKVFRMKLVSPIPSLSTHSMNSLLAPVIHWDEVVSDEKK